MAQSKFTHVSGRRHRGILFHFLVFLLGDILLTCGKIGGSNYDSLKVAKCLVI